MKQVKELAATELENWPPSGRPGMEVAVNQAKIQVKSLLGQYRTLMADNSAVVYVNGTDEKCAKVEEEGRIQGTVVVDGSGLYRSIAENVYSKLGDQKRLLPVFVVEIQNQLNQAANSFNINASWLQVDTASYNAEIKGIADLIKIVRDTARTSTPGYVPPLGDTLAVLAAREQFFAMCEQTTLAELPVAVMVSRLQPEELKGFQEGFMPGRPFTVLEASKVKSAEKSLVDASKELAKKLGLDSKQTQDGKETK